MSEFPWTDKTDCAHEHAYAAEAEVRRLRARVFELERERDEARDSDRESLAMYRRCRADRDALRAKLAETEREAERLIAGRPCSACGHWVTMHDDEQSVREIVADRDALAAKLSEARSLCYRASRSDMLPAEILGELAGIVGEVDDDG